MKRAIVLALVAASLAACGMNRAVGVLPNTLDDLAEKTAPLRGDPDERPDGAEPRS